MQNNPSKKELVLEVQKDGYRKLIFRQNIGKGTMLFLEESDLIDFSRPLTYNNDFNVFFTERAFWKSFIEYTSNEGLLKREVWHEKTNDWVSLKPVFVHSAIKHLIQESLSDVIRNLSGNETDILDDLRVWLVTLSAENQGRYQFAKPFNTLRHAV